MNAAAFYGRGISKMAIGQSESACADISKASKLGFKQATAVLKTDCK